MAEKSNRRLILNIFFLLLPILFSDCANQLPPGGGEIDTMPPEITAVYPSDGTINYDDDHIEIEFSEYIDKRSFQDALFISPAFQGQPELDWSGHSVRINFPEKLKDSITYVVSIGTDVVDLNNKNRMAGSYTFSFSTGSRIDYGLVNGRVYEAEPSGTMLFAFPLDTALIDPTKEKPKYISQAGKTGEYSLRGLSPGNYRVFAVKDEFRDLIYDVGTDSYGSPFRDISISETDSAFKNLNFFLTKEDTAKPRLISASMTDRFHILVGFSEPVDSTLYSSGNFYLVDSTQNKTFQPVYAFQGRGKRGEMVLALKENFSDQNNIFLFAKKITDLNGNSTSNDYTRLTVSDKPDTSAAILIKAIPQDRATNVETSRPVISFFLDDGFDSLRIKSSAISITDRAGGKYPFNLRFFDDASFSIKIMTDLKPKQDYYINLNLKSITDLAGNSVDSVYKYSFVTFTGTDFSGVSGEVKPAKNMSSKDIMVVLQNVQRDRPIYKKKTGNKLEYNFNKVEPGRYLLWSFQSSDSTGSFNYGKPVPFKPSDRFTFYPDTLNLRARWPVSDIIISY